MSRMIRPAIIAVALAVAVGCSIRDAACGNKPSNVANATPDQIAAATTGTTAPQHFKILFLGDSLTAGLGLLTDDAYPRLIQKKFSDEGYSNVEIANASVSGDTTAGGVQRLENALDA